MYEFRQFRTRTLHGQEVLLSHYTGDAFLVVNTASKCGFTPQYAGLEALYRKYSKDGLVALGFPYNQFGRQEPLDASTIESSCLVVTGVSFPILEKIDVEGPHAHRYSSSLPRGFPASWGIPWSGTSLNS
jgi:glutathione peroxidase